MTRIKVCCIASVEEARLAIELGADALGLVSEMPSGPGVIPPELIAEIAVSVPPPIATFLLTRRTNFEGIVEQHRECGANTLQLCDRVDSDVHLALRRELPGVRVVQVVHVEAAGAVAEACRVGRTADAVLLDSGRPGAAIPELGGTGRVHDWTLSRRIVEECEAPVFLAGGLGPDNVEKAIAEVRPFGVDLCTGVRTEGRLDPAKLERFVARVRGCR